MPTKICRSCSETKPISDYLQNRSYCRTCRLLKAKLPKPLGPGIKCKVCTKEFISPSSRAIFCSPKCLNKHSYQKHKEYHRQYGLQKRLKKEPIKQCKMCNKDFKTSVSKLLTLCSIECKKAHIKSYYKYYFAIRKKPLFTYTCSKCQQLCENKNPRTKTCKPCKSIKYIRVKKIVIPKDIQCSFCNKELKDVHGNKRYCSKSCTRKDERRKDPLYNRKRQIRKRLREATIKLRTPKWANKRAIEQYYLNCPEGYSVDHIIPLKGKEVSGLHVVDNFQYLTIEANTVKNCKFDFTYNNDSWKTH